MEKFSIGFSENVAVRYGENCALGEIAFGAKSEAICSPLTYWNQQQYKMQWKKGIERILEGRDRSALITVMRDPAISNFIEWWVFYLFESEVIFRNQMFRLDQFEGKLDEMNFYQYIPDRYEAEHGDAPPSEWRIELDALKVFSMNAD